MLNLCDANIVVDADESLSTGDVLIKQASYYFMGHFSRYFTPGMKHVALTNTVETEPPPLKPADIKNGVALRFLPCEPDNAIQRFSSGADGTTLIAHGTDAAPGSDGYGVGGECMEHCISGECWFPKTQLWACGTTDEKHGLTGNQAWRMVPTTGGIQFVNEMTNNCLVALHAPGYTVGLDAGLKVIAAQTAECDKSASQLFVLESPGDIATGATGGDADVAESFMVRNVESGFCLQPQIEKLPHFDAVAFADKDGDVSVTVMNTNDDAIELTLHDEAAGLSVETSVGAHAIQTYRWNANKDAHKKGAATTALAAAAAVPQAAAPQAAAPATSSASSVAASMLGAPSSGAGASAALHTVLTAAMPTAARASTTAAASVAAISTDDAPQNYEWSSHGLVVVGLGCVALFAAILAATATNRARLIAVADADPSADDEAYVAFVNAHAAGPRDA